MARRQRRGANSIRARRANGNNKRSGQSTVNATQGVVRIHVGPIKGSGGVIEVSDFHDSQELKAYLAGSLEYRIVQLTIKSEPLSSGEAGGVISLLAYPSSTMKPPKDLASLMRAGKTTGLARVRKADQCGGFPNWIPVGADPGCGALVYTSARTTGDLISLEASLIVLKRGVGNFS